MFGMPATQSVTGEASQLVHSKQLHLHRETITHYLPSVSPEAAAADIMISVSVSVRVEEC